MQKHMISAGFALFIATAAGAHEFTVTLVVPENGTRQARNAFLLASSERDGHRDETSEGHLGGLDSQLEIVTPGKTLPPSDIVVAIAPATVAQTGPDIWTFSLGAISARATSAFLGTGENAFGARYQARYTMLPDDTATRTYVAARLIDLAVRAQAGIANIPALGKAIEGY